jgi:hypothetical protein
MIAKLHSTVMGLLCVCTYPCFALVTYAGCAKKYLTIFVKVKWKSIINAGYIPFLWEYMLIIKSLLFVYDTLVTTKSFCTLLQSWWKWCHNTWHFLWVLYIRLKLKCFKSPICQDVFCIPCFWHSPKGSSLVLQDQAKRLARWFIGVIYCLTQHVEY